MRAVRIVAALAILGGCLAVSGNASAAPRRCFGEAPTIVAVEGQRTRGTSGDDVIVGTDGDDRITGLGGDDLICSGGGDDVVFGGSGDNSIDLGRGDDEGIGAGGRDRILGAAGNDRMLGNEGRDHLDGGTGTDDCDAGTQQRDVERRCERADDGGGGEGPPRNPGDAVNCSDFSSQAAAQAWFDRYYPYYGDVAGLDDDDDRIACESL